MVAMTGATNTAAVSTVAAITRLQKVLSALLTDVPLKLPAEIFMIVFPDSRISTCVDSLLAISDR